MTVPNFRPQVGELIQFIKSDGTVYDLNSPPRRGVMNMTGWGKPPEEKHTISGPFQHGDTLVSYRLLPRTISLDITHPKISRSEWFSGHSELLDQLGLNNASPGQPEPGILRWEYIENGVHKIRCLDVYLNRGLGFTPLDGWRNWTIAEGLEFIADNPVIYDPTLKTATITSFTTTLRFAITFPFTLGAEEGSATIVYAGTWETLPEIILTGPMFTAYIENESTGTHIRLNYNISSGEVVTIERVRDQISVTNNLGQNLLRYITDDSNISDFSLQDSNIVVGGSNVINVILTGSGAGTAVQFNYYNRYYGI